MTPVERLLITAAIRWNDAKEIYRLRLSQPNLDRLREAEEELKISVEDLERERR